MKNLSDSSPQPLATSTFSMHPKLEADAIYAGDLILSRVMLMNNANFPWLILVPRVENASELFDLSQAEQQQLLKEVSFVSETMKKIFSADKMNIAMLGNQVPQLHCHVIARIKGDKAWPNPVWGGASQKYTEIQREEVLAKLSSMFVSRRVA